MTTPSSRIPAEAIDSLLLDTSPYLSCNDCFAQIDTYVEGLIADPTYQDIPMQVHLHACGVCAEEAETLIALLRGEDG